jgi:hypothetical protein
VPSWLLQKNQRQVGIFGFSECPLVVVVVVVVVRVLFQYHNRRFESEKIRIQGLLYMGS